ncbi:MAG: amidohydrolase family protein [Planctomycetaceae bacterium]
MMNRRQMLTACSAAAGVSVGKQAHGVLAIQKPASRFIDMHTHIGTYTNGSKELTAKALVEWMDGHDIAKAVVLPLVSPESTTYLQLPDAAIQASREFPDRLVPFCSIDPRAIIRGGVQGLIDIIRKYVDQGARGFGEHKVGLEFDDPLMMRVYEACETVGIPLLFHIDNIRGKDEPGLPHLENAVRSFPKLTFIGHGPGWWASISGVSDQKELGGYPQHKVTPGGAIDRLMDKYTNIYGDLSAGSGANAISRDLEFGREFLIRRQDRICFGTDYLQPGQHVPQFELFEKLHDLPQTVQDKIFRQNAEHVLGLNT